MVKCPHTMTESTKSAKNETGTEESVIRIYEAGYHLSPSIKEEEVVKVVDGIRAVIEKAGGSFIAEGAPALTRLAYPLSSTEGGKRVEHDRAFFGWIKFEAAVGSVEKLEAALERSADVIRSIVFQTVREDTRARIKAPSMREVKRSETIKAPARHTEEQKAPVSEEDLDKALKDLTDE